MRAFISYSSKDMETARRVAELFRVKGAAVWIDEGELGPGDLLADRLASAISELDVFVIVYTDNARVSPWVKRELSLALTRMVEDGVKIIPLRFDESPLPDSLRGLVWADCRTESDLRRAINAAVGGLTRRSLLSDAEVEARHERREGVEHGIRLIPNEVSNLSDSLGPEERRYVCIGDYAEQRGRSLRQIKRSLGAGDAFDTVEGERINWSALVFEIGAINQHKCDLLPGTWKAVFRVLSDKSRLGLIVPSVDEYAELGTRPRDYISGNQGYWYGRITSDDRRKNGIGPEKLLPDTVLKTHFGIDDLSFEGGGLSDRRRWGNNLPLGRIFLIKNMRISDLDLHRQDLGRMDDGVVLW